jgi:HEAT repeat protein
MPAVTAPIPPGGAAQTGELALINNRANKIAAAIFAVLVTLSFGELWAQNDLAIKAKDQYARIVDSLWIRAASGDIKFKDQVDPCKKSIIEMGTKAIPQMLTKLNTRDAREIQTVIDIFKGIGEPAVKPLSTYVNDSDPFSRRASIRCLEEIKSPLAVSALLTVVNHDDYRTRAAAISALGSIGDVQADDAVMRALTDKNELVATSGAVACGKIKTGINIHLLIGALLHPYYGVRYSAAKALAEMGEIAVDPLIAHLDTFPNNKGAEYIIMALGNIGSPRASAALESALKSDQWTIRAAAAEAMGHFPAKKFHKSLNNALKLETQPLVIAKIKGALIASDTDNGS